MDIKSSPVRYCTAPVVRQAMSAVAASVATLHKFARIRQSVSVVPWMLGDLPIAANSDPTAASLNEHCSSVAE